MVKATRSHRKSLKRKRRVSGREIERLLAREVPPDIRLAARLGKRYEEFQNAEAILGAMREDGLIDLEAFKPVSISKEDVAGMDSRTIEEIIRDPIINDTLTLREVIELVEARNAQDQDRSTRKLVKQGKAFLAKLAKAGIIESELPSRAGSPRKRGKQLKPKKAHRAAVTAAQRPHKAALKTTGSR